MFVVRRATFLSIALMFALAQARAEANWPQWRGPNGTGVSNAKGLPEKWSETEGILWKTPLPSWSGSSPVVWQDRIYIISPSTDTEDPAATGHNRFSSPGGDDLLLLCLAKADGKILWQKVLDSGNELGRKGNSTSPSPVTDGKHVWTLTGTGTVTAMTLDGEVVWKKNMQKEFGPFGLNFGYASSPVLLDGMLIAQVLHGFHTDDPSYLVAFDANTGEVKWRVDRPTNEPSETPDSYNTPSLLKVGDTTQIIVCGGGYVSGHDPKTGKEIWRAGGLNPNNNPNYRTIASCVAADGMVYAPTRQRPLLAVRADGKDDVTATHVAWKWEKAYGPDVPTPACDGKYLYMVDDKGVVNLVDAKTGNVIWGPEHTERGTVSASPLVADGKLYITTEAGVTTVLAAGPEYKVIATNTLPGEDHTLSSMAACDGMLFLRTPSSLYCIGEKP